METNDINKTEQGENPGDKNKSGGLLKNIGGYSIKYLLPVALTVLLVWYMFSKVSFKEMMDIIRHGVNYWWILLAMGISVFSHIFRAMRWQLQLRALGIKAGLMELSCSVFGCYALNLLFPRLGEVWRCTYVSQKQKAPFTKVLGSMVADRLADTLTVLMLTLFTFVIATQAVNSFLVKYPVGRGLLEMFENPWFWAAVAGVIVASVLVYKIFGETKIVKKLKDWMAELWKGFSVIATMPGRGRFIALTGCIWGCYYLQLYVAFFAFPFTEELCTQPALAYGLIPCLVAFVLSSIGMAVPSNGGLGPWNIAVMFGLAVYGINEAQGTAFSMLQWSGQTVMLILLGIFTMVYIVRTGSKKK